MKRYRVILKKEETYIVYADSLERAEEKAIAHDIDKESHWQNMPYTEIETEEVP